MTGKSNLPTATMGPIDTKNRVASPAHPLDKFGGDELMSLAQYKTAAFAGFDNDAVICRLRSAHEMMHKGFVAVREALKAPDPQMTREAHTLSIKRKADTYLQAAGNRWDETMKIANASLSEVESAIRAKIGPASTLSQEIRAHLRSLKPAERNALAQSAAQTGDTLTLAAILDGPAYLCGLVDEQREVAKASFLKGHAPELLSRKAAIEAALSINSLAHVQAMEGIGQFFDRKTIDSITDHTARSQAAAAAIDKAIA